MLKRSSLTRLIFYSKLIEMPVAGILHLEWSILILAWKHSMGEAKFLSITESRETVPCDTQHQVEMAASPFSIMFYSMFCGLILSFKINNCL